VVGLAEDGAASSIPLDLKEAGGRRHFPGLLQETAAAHFPSNGDGKRDGTILQETGAGGLRGGGRVKIDINLLNS
jgi:hypothetical protein